MASEVTNYKCPACTGPLHFEESSGKLECEFCGSAYEVEEIEALYEKQDREAEKATGSWADNVSGTQWDQAEGGMRAYSCPSCGAEILCDETTAATACPYCGNPTIVPGQFAGTLRPDYVIPFKLDKEAAVAALKKHCKGKPLLPRLFASANHLEEVKGIYVPFWLFGGRADADASYRCTRTRVYTSGDERVTETDHFIVERAGSVEFSRIPVDGSSKMPDAHMDAIEPYDYSELKPFSTAYLPGFLADKYDVDVLASSQRADQRCRNSALDTLQSTVLGYSSCVTVRSHVDLDRGPVEYALLPVWLLSTRWKDKNFLFAMNGQTGKLVGDLPVSWGKFWAWFAGIFGGLALILALILFL